MTQDPICDVSVVIPFCDDEERVGALGRRVAAHLRALGLRFEILAVDEDCRDNSLALLQLLQLTIPELRIVLAEHGLGFATGSAFARGQVVWLLDPVTCGSPSALPFGWAHQQLRDGATDIVSIKGRFLVCRRARAWKLLSEVRGRGDLYERRLLKRAAGRRLRVTSWAAQAPVRPRLQLRTLLRLRRA